MPEVPSALSPKVFRFFRDLARNNNKDWMDRNRDRYQRELVQPLRELLSTLTPGVLKLYPGFDVSGRTGVNFSRINRDIRFAKDKTPYRAQMYVSFPPQGGKNRRAGELYVGLNSDSATVGFRIYFDPKSKNTACGKRIDELPAWSAKQKKRLSRKYESYWYSMEKGEWTKNDGWPATPEEWKKLKAWIVRRTMKPSATTRPAWKTEVLKIFADLFPLFEFITANT